MNTKLFCARTVLYIYALRTKRGQSEWKNETIGSMKKASYPNGARRYAWLSWLELEITRKQVVTGRGKGGAGCGTGDRRKVKRIMIDRSQVTT